MNRRPALVIAGGGLAGSLTALALAQRRPEVDFLLIEAGDALGGNHVWSFFDSDLDDEMRKLVAPLVTQRWPAHEVRFPKRERRIDVGYNSVRSAQLERVVRNALPPGRIRRARIADLGPGHVLLEGGERIETEGVLDARGPSDFAGLDLGWQKFVGRTYRFAAGHGQTIPTIMDAMVPQHDGYRFVYTLPFSATELMVEDTYYSDTPLLDVGDLRMRIDQYAARFGPAELAEEETGVLPVVLGGDPEALWPREAPVARLGLRGGFFHPTTGYSLPDASANALVIAGQADLSGPALHDLFRRRALSLWKARGIFRMLNRLLFRAGREEERYRVLEHFYRLPDATVGRFYAAKLTRLDKLRVLTGKPPVPFGRALAVMRDQAA